MRKKHDLKDIKLDRDIQPRDTINPETVAVTPITLIERHGLQHLI